MSCKAPLTEQCKAPTKADQCRALMPTLNSDNFSCRLLPVSARLYY